MPTALGILAVIGLLCANAFFVASEFSLVSVDRDRINSKKSYRAQVVAKLQKRLTFHLTGSQLGITAVALLLGFIAEPTIGELVEPLAEDIFGAASAHGASIAIALAAATILHMVVGEQIPKIFSLSKSLGTSMALAPIVRIYSLLVYPIVRASNGLANSILKAMGIAPANELLNVRRRGDLEDMIRSSQAGGTIDRTDMNLLTRSLYFGEKDIMDVLVPRIAVESLELDETVQAFVEKAHKTGFSRFPVTGGDLDDVKGVAHIKSVYKIPRQKWNEVLVSELMSDVLAVPETLPLADLLRDMTSQKSPLAVAVDEHGGTSGIVTAEDILEQIVGEIADEYDDPAPAAAETVGNGDFLFAGSIQMQELKKRCGFSAPEGPYETLGGFILYNQQRIPRPKEIFHHRGWWFEVVEMQGHRITSVKISRPPGITGISEDK